MMTIPVVNIGAKGDDLLLAPAQPFPADAIAIVCDGQQYTVYQRGDEIPATE
ncbi:hypothetical protein ACKI2N_012355 [Cupriavidus sp. 30B13]|uniref:hypothetical protein n=1 Tax=Cupriavidus sp. 30B13 TaxID=3384241 RepID=UPI003B91CC69